MDVFIFVQAILLTGCEVRPVAAHAILRHQLGYFTDHMGLKIEWLSLESVFDCALIYKLLRIR